MPPPLVAVAASGGRDSTALLHCTARQAAALGVKVIALHVHHGLMPEADDWLKRVRDQARRWGAGFAATRAVGSPALGESVEAWARQARYTALAAMAHDHGCSLVLLAHHRRDQAETFLLQALRGAGTAGLAAMPRQVEREGITWARPWLDCPLSAIEAYVRRHRLQVVQDASNADPRYARSRIRTAVWPVLDAAFPDAEQALAMAASHAQDTLALAREAADADLSVLSDARGLAIPAWLHLPPARRRNALRAWLHAAAGVPAAATLVSRLLTELPGASAARWPGSGGNWRLHRGHLCWVSDEAAPAVDAPTSVPVDLSEPGTVTQPGWPGHWRVTRTREGGLPAPLLRELIARPREGGERLRLRRGASSRSLKQHFQAAGVPAWQREAPLLFTPQGALVFVPGLGADAAFQAGPGEDQRQLQWVPGTSPRTGSRQPGR